MNIYFIAEREDEYGPYMLVKCNFKNIDFTSCIPIDSRPEDTNLVFDYNNGSVVIYHFTKKRQKRLYMTEFCIYDIDPDLACTFETEMTKLLKEIIQTTYTYIKTNGNLEQAGDSFEI